MKAIGIAKASRRLAAAEERLKRLHELSTGIDVPAFQDEWYHFLCDLQAVPEILATSSRSDPRSQQWFFGQKKKEIENDPLLDFFITRAAVTFMG